MPPPSTSFVLASLMQDALRVVQAQLQSASPLGAASKAHGAPMPPPSDKRVSPPLSPSRPSAASSSPQPPSLAGIVLPKAPSIPLVRASTTAVAEMRALLRLRASESAANALGGDGAAALREAASRVLHPSVASNLLRQVLGSELPQKQRDRTSSLVIALEFNDAIMDGGDLAEPEGAGSLAVGDEAALASDNEQCESDLDAPPSAPFDPSSWGLPSEAVTDASFVPSAWMASKSASGAPVVIDAHAVAAALNELPVVRGALTALALQCDTQQSGTCNLVTSTGDMAPPIAVHVQYKPAIHDDVADALPVLTPCKCGLCDAPAAAGASFATDGSNTAQESSKAEDALASGSPSAALQAAWDAHDHLHASKGKGTPDAPSAAASATASLFLHAAGATFGPLLTGAGLHGLEPALVSPLSACGGSVELRRSALLASKRSPVVALALRGTCTFAEKARAAQAAGASALLVLDVDVGVGLGPHVPSALLTDPFRVQGAPPAAAAGAGPGSSGSGGGPRPLFDPTTATMAGGGPGDDVVAIPSALLSGSQVDCLLAALAVRASPLAPLAGAVPYPVLGTTELHAFRRDAHHSLAPSRPARLCLFNPADRDALPPSPRTQREPPEEEGCCSEAQQQPGAPPVLQAIGHNGYTLVWSDAAQTAAAVVQQSGQQPQPKGGLLQQTQVVPGLLPPPASLVAELVRSVLLEAALARKG